VDTEAEQALARAANITSIPTLMAFREGVLVYSQPGALPPQALDELIGAVRGLNMEEVHATVAAQQNGGTPPEA
jgi:thioredoxin 1